MITQMWQGEGKIQTDTVLNFTQTFIPNIGKFTHQNQQELNSFKNPIILLSVLLCYAFIYNLPGATEYGCYLSSS